MELLSPLGFALAAAREGTAVHVFVQGPAVRVRLIAQDFTREQRRDFTVRKQILWESETATDGCAPSNWR